MKINLVFIHFDKQMAVVGGGGSKIQKLFGFSAAAACQRTSIGGGGSKIRKFFAFSAAAADFLYAKSAAAAAEPIGLHL